MQRIIEGISKMSGAYRPQEIFTDWVKMMGVAITQQVIYKEKLEQQYLDITKKYTTVPR